MQASARRRISRKVDGALSDRTIANVLLTRTDGDSDDDHTKNPRFVLREGPDELAAVTNVLYRRAWRLKVFIDNLVSYREVQVTVGASFGEISESIECYDKLPKTQCYRLEMHGVWLHPSWLFGEVLWWSSAPLVAHRQTIKPITLVVKMPFRKDEYMVRESDNDIHSLYPEQVMTYITRDFGLPAGVFRIGMRKYRGDPGGKDVKVKMSPTYVLPPPEMAEEKMAREVARIRTLSQTVEAYPLLHFSKFPRQYSCDTVDDCFELFSDWRPPLPSKVDGEYEDSTYDDDGQDTPLRMFPRNTSFGELGMRAGDEIWLQVRAGFSPILRYLIPGPHREFKTFQDIVDELTNDKRTKEEKQYLIQVTLYIAAYYNNVPLIEYLFLKDVGMPQLPVGQHPKCNDTGGGEADCPLHIAVRRNNMETVRCFATYRRLCLWVKNDEGVDAVELASKYGYTEMVKFLEEERVRPLHLDEPAEGRLTRYQKLYGRREEMDYFQLAALVKNNQLKCFDSMSIVEEVATEVTFADLVTKVKARMPPRRQRRRRNKNRPLWLDNKMKAAERFRSVIEAEDAREKERNLRGRGAEQSKEHTRIEQSDDSKGTTVGEDVAAAAERFKRPLAAASSLAREKAKPAESQPPKEQKQEKPSDESKGTSGCESDAAAATHQPGVDTEKIKDTDKPQERELETSGEHGQDSKEIGDNDEPKNSTVGEECKQEELSEESEGSLAGDENVVMPNIDNGSSEVEEISVIDDPVQREADESEEHKLEETSEESK
eukprot:scpid24290/ scgid16595/ 